jgi:DNA processing protein
MLALKRLTAEAIPAPLREIPEPPTVLYLAGDWPTDDYHYLTVVGSRRYSGYGQDACRKIIRELAGQAIAIVSGLALGIDAVAHQTALDVGLPTIAFPGSGLDFSVLHPHSNQPLARQILEAGGALVSELEPTCPAGLHTFPRRNRLMAGLSRATLVIEAGERSGTLITARLALDYNRDVYAVPGSIFADGSLGANRLIARGATPVTCGRDILTAFGWDPETAPAATREWADLNETEQKVVALLALEALERDELIRRLDLSASEINPLLVGLEIKGVITESLGQIHLV